MSYRYPVGWFVYDDKIGVNWGNVLRVTNYFGLRTFF